MMKSVPFKTVAYPQLKEALQSSGMTPPELSKKIGVSPLCVWRWTTGKNEFSIGVIKAILAAAGSLTPRMGYGSPTKRGLATVECWITSE